MPELLIRIGGAKDGQIIAVSPDGSPRGRLERLPRFVHLLINTEEDLEPLAGKIVDIDALPSTALTQCANTDEAPLALAELVFSETRPVSESFQGMLGHRQAEFEALELAQIARSAQKYGPQKE